MNEYTVMSPNGLVLQVDAVVKLTDRQLGPRRHQVAPVKGRKGVFVVREPLTFKRGEVITIDGALPKNMAALTDKPAPAAEPTLSQLQQDARDRGDGPAPTTAIDPTT